MYFFHFGFSITIILKFPKLFYCKFKIIGHGNLLPYYFMTVSSCTPTIFFLHPTMLCKDQTVPIILKNLKMHLNCIYFFFLSGLWNLEKLGLALSVQFRIHQSVTEICIPDSEIHN